MRSGTRVSTPSCLLQTTRLLCLVLVCSPRLQGGLRPRSVRTWDEGDRQGLNLGDGVWTCSWKHSKALWPWTSSPTSCFGSFANFVLFPSSISEESFQMINLGWCHSLSNNKTLSFLLYTGWPVGFLTPLCASPWGFSLLINTPPRHVFTLKFTRSWLTWNVQLAVAP